MLITVKTIVGMMRNCGSCIEGFIAGRRNTTDVIGLLVEILFVLRAVISIENGFGGQSANNTQLAVDSKYTRRTLGFVPLLQGSDVIDTERIANHDLIILSSQPLGDLSFLAR